MIMLHINEKFIQLLIYLFGMTEYIIKKPPVPTKPATVILTNVKSYHALLCMLLACIGSYRKLVEIQIF